MSVFCICERNCINRDVQVHLGSKFSASSGELKKNPSSNTLILIDIIADITWPSDCTLGILQCNWVTQEIAHNQRGVLFVLIKKVHMGIALHSWPSQGDQISIPIDFYINPVECVGYHRHTTCMPASNDKHMIISGQCTYASLC